jgi:RimJ/RimL family protein N-acetyltransferase
MIRLREIRLGDMELLHKWINDPEIIRFTNSFRPISEMEQADWAKNVSYFRNNFVFGIERIEDSTLIGTCGLYDIDHISHKAELRMKICVPSERGKGYGKASLDLLLNFGFNDANLRKIWLRVLSSNTAAVKLYEKGGFVHEGTMRKDMFIKGTYEDVTVMSLLNTEFQALNKTSK